MLTKDPFSSRTLFPSIDLIAPLILEPAALNYCVPSIRSVRKPITTPNLALQKHVATCINNTFDTSPSTNTINLRGRTLILCLQQALQNNNTEKKNSLSLMKMVNLTDPQRKSRTSSTLFPASSMKRRSSLLMRSQTQNRKRQTTRILVLFVLMSFRQVRW